MTDFTIITTEAEFQRSADYFKKDPSADLYLYRGDPDSNEEGDVVAHVPHEKFVAIYETEPGDTQSPQPEP